MGTISQKLTYLNGTKQAIRSAIEANGVYVDDEDTFRSYADKIRNVNTLRIDTSWYYFCDVYNKTPISKVSINPAKIDVEQFYTTSDFTGNRTITGSMSNVPVGQYVIAAVVVRGNADELEGDDISYSDDWQLVHTTPIVTSWEVVSGTAYPQRMFILIKQASGDGMLSTESLTFNYAIEHTSFVGVSFMTMFYIYGLRSFEYDSTYDVDIINPTLQADIDKYPMTPADKPEGQKMIWLMHSAPPQTGTPSWSWATNPADILSKYSNNRIGVFVDFGDGATHRTFYRTGDNRDHADAMSVCALKFTT